MSDESEFIKSLPPEIAAMYVHITQPVVIDFIDGVRNITGFELPVGKNTIFLHFHDYITNPQPAFITKWRKDNEREKLYHRFVNGVLGNVQNAYACTTYHYQNLSNIERDVMAFAEDHGALKALGNSTLALGNSLKWDFEYQAFVMSYRRCLDYLADAISCYFRERCNSFRDLPKWLERKRPAEVAKVLIAAHQRHVSNFKFVMSQEGLPSTRDKIAHYEFVGAGCINISNRGFMLAGGGENIDPFEDDNRLSIIVGQRMSHLENALEDILRSFVAAMRENEATSS